MFTRSLVLPEPGAETFFLWGPRQAGKSTLLKARYGGSRWVDLLKADEFRRYASRPELLRQEILAGPFRPGEQVVIDEVQKVPALLDEVHWLMETHGVCFALCGSSARKVRRGAANLLGGRALRYDLHGLTAHEVGAPLDLDRLLNHGYLPRVYEAAQPRRLLDAYIADYLKEEIAAEGLVRNLPTFSEFLDVAALSDCEMVNLANIARDCGVSGHTVKGWFEILEDTLLGRWLPAWRRRARRRVVAAPKFYFSDVGVVNRLARRGELHAGSDTYGKAFENWVFHELTAWIGYHDIDAPLSYWRLASGIEVDFVVGDMQCAIEAKSSARVTNDHLKGLRSLGTEHAEVGRRIVVCREAKARRTDDGIDIWPADVFVEHLWSGEMWASRGASTSRR